MATIESTLDVFTRAYLECALWSTCDDNDAPLDQNYGVADFDKATLIQSAIDCQAFQAEFWQDIAGREEKAGFDFWLTRNGHGAGFWDGDWGDNGDKLTAGSKAYGSVDLYVCDGEVCS